MCYGTCHFEDSMGDCKIWNYKKFEAEFGESACRVGGYADSSEAYEYIQENQERFREIRKIAYEKKLVW